MDRERGDDRQRERGLDNGQIDKLRECERYIQGQTERDRETKERQ